MSSIYVALGSFVALGSLNAWVIYTTPSHQHPLGVTMSLKRRLDLLDYAQRHSAWIIEDDYDSEYRYRGRPSRASMTMAM